MATIGNTLNRITREIESLVGTILPPEVLDGYLPAADIADTSDALLIRLDVPGLSKSQLTVTVQDGMLTVRGERATDALGTYTKRERRYGAFQRTFTLPDGVVKSDVAAGVKDGVLTLTVTKRTGSHDPTISID
jgi:HSP20 family protein